MIIITQVLQGSHHFRKSLHEFLDRTLVQNEVTNANGTHPGLCGCKEEHKDFYHGIQEFFSPYPFQPCLLIDTYPFRMEHILTFFCNGDSIQTKQMHIGSLGFHVSVGKIIAKRKPGERLVDLLG